MDGTPMNFGKRQPKFLERRKAERRSCNFRGTILIDGANRVGCSVVNISAIGALLAVPSILGIPMQFELQVGHGPRRRVEVARRGRSFLGVRFV
jgi:hypothetical protein